MQNKASILRPTHPFTGSLLLVLAYVGSGWLFRTPALDSITHVLAWPPVGIALGVVLLCGPRVWPGMVVAAFLEPWLAGFPLSRSLGSSSGLILEVLGSAWVLRQLGFRNSLERVRDVLYFAGVAVLGGSLLGAALNTSYQVLVGMRPASDFLRYCFTCYRGDALAFLLITPVVLTWGSDLRFTWLRRRPTEALSLLATVLLLSLYVAGAFPSVFYPNFPMRNILLPLLIWAALRFGPAGSAATVLLIVGIVSQGRWLYTPAGEAGEIVTNRLALLWGYSLFGALMAMVLAAVARQQERARTQADLIREANLALTRSLDVRAVLNTLLGYAEQLVPYDTANVMLLEGDELVVSAGRHYSEQVQQAILGRRFSLADLPMWDAVRDGKPVLVHDTRAEPRWITMQGTEYVRNWLAVPIKAGDEVIGLYAFDKAEPLFYNEEHARLAESLSAQAAVAIENARLYQQRKQAEEALRHSEERFSKAFYSHPNPMVLSRLKDGRLIDCNESFLRFFGYLREEALGLPAWDFYVHPADRDRLAEHIRKEQRFRDQELQMRIKSGEIRTVLASAELIQIAGEQCVLGVIRDITQRRKAEQALWASEERFVKGFRTSPALMVILSLPDLCVADINDSMLRVIGFSREEVLGRTGDELGTDVDPVARDRLRDLLQREGHVSSVGYALRARSGELKHILLSAEIIDFVGVPHALVVGLDVTEQRRLEERFQKAFQASPAAMAISSVDEGRYTDVNQAFCKMMGLTREELLGHTPDELGLTTDPQRRAAFYSELRQKGQVVGAPFSMRARSGRVISGLLSAEIIDLAGKPHILFVGLDLTEQQRLEEQFRKAFRSNPMAMAISTLSDGRYVDVNDGYLHMLGYTREEVIGHTIFELNVWAEPEKRPELLELLRTQGRVENYEIALRAKSGEAKPGLLSADTMDLGGVPHLLSAVLDLTEYRKLEEQFRQSQKMEAIGRLAGGVAHDFNNLLMVMIGRADLLMVKLKEGDSALKSVEEIQKAAWRASSLTRQLLAFSRKQRLQPKVLNLNASVADMEKMLRRLIGADVRMVVETHPALGNIKADPGGIEQVLMNLCVNARDAMPRGGTLTIYTANAEFDVPFPLRHGTLAPGRYVLLSVSDTGVGMDLATQARIFEPFFTTKEAGKGTGLGLSTVYGIVQQSGGTISVYSEPGRGTSFKIYFPLVEEAAERAADAAAAPLARGSETVLVVEDEDAVRSIACEYLAVAGYTVLEARNAAEALELCRQRNGPVHLLLTDVILPGISGRELAERLRPQQPKMGVLFLSGYSSDVVTGQGLLPVGSLLLEKPFRLSDFASKVRLALDTTPATA